MQKALELGVFSRIKLPRGVLQPLGVVNVPLDSLAAGFCEDSILESLTAERLV
jgi:hypothetical protein